MFKNQAIKGLAAGFAVTVGLASCTELPNNRNSSRVTEFNDGAVSHIVIDKSDRIMELFNAQGQVIKSYDVGLGFNPIGDKVRKGDGRTPEGTYIIDRKNPNSSFTLSLGISYPDVNDRKEAYANGVNPGGDIFIHGLPTGKGDNWRSPRGTDWTAGCISVNNSEIREIYSIVEQGTTITITP